MIKTGRFDYKWIALALAVLTYASNGAVRMCLPVLFKEISTDLHLSLVNVGTIWGMDPLAGVFIGLPAGLLADRFGVKRTLIIVCFLEGLFGAMRGLSVNFASLTAIMFVFGVMAATMPSVVPKATAVWFRGRNLGISQALLIVAGSLGQMSGTMFSATVFLPLLGGWRHVLFLYAIPPVIMSLMWVLFGREPEKSAVRNTIPLAVVPPRQALSQVVRIKRIWLIGLVQMCQNGAFAGLTGYLPLYLRSIGWAPASADGAMTILTGISLVGAIPMVLLAYRLGSPKRMLMFAVIMISTTLGFLSIASGTEVWLLLIINGALRGGTNSLFSVMTLETEGVGGTYAGTALGLQYTISMMGGFFGPPLGNSMAVVSSGFPFAIWGGLSAVALLGFIFIKN
jgi:MFS family permease